MPSRVPAAKKNSSTLTFGGSVPAQRERVVELGKAGEHAVRDRLEEAPFEVALAARLLQGERGEDAKLDRGIGGRALKQRVGDVIGLAEAERHRQLDVFADAFDDRVGQAICILERDWRASATRHTNTSVAIRDSGRVPS